MYIFSACLLGEKCKYNGGDNACEAVQRLAERVNYVSVCPEVAGGLSIPRAPAELQKGPNGIRVADRDGKDVTEAFCLGAEREWTRVREEAERLGEPIEGAILRRGSPSCGVGWINDGTFTKKKTAGDGIFAGLLKKNGIRVMTEEEQIDD